MLIKNTADFSPSLIFGCGQCFRFRPDSGGVWSGVAFGRTLTAAETGEGVLLGCSPEEYDLLWSRFFDAETDYAAAREAVSVTPFMAAAALFGRGIRILRQDFWEALCSFIISQCNNIPRIMGIIERLCAAYGAPADGGRYSFPGAEALASLPPEALRAAGTGYRAPYIIAAARAVVSGTLDEKKLSAMSSDEARTVLKNIEGVGPKVADCVLLYGLHRLDAFPVDTWMRRALDEHFPPGFDPAVFGRYAGIAQQYIFHYVRHLAKAVPSRAIGAF